MYTLSAQGQSSWLGGETTCAIIFCTCYMHAVGWLSSMGSFSVQHLKDWGLVGGEGWKGNRPPPIGAAPVNWCKNKPTDQLLLAIAIYSSPYGPEL